MHLKFASVLENDHDKISINHWKNDLFIIWFEML